MTRTHAASRLLEHGPLTMGEFVAITGWKPYRCNNVLIRLRKQGRVCVANIDGLRKYELS